MSDAGRWAALYHYRFDAEMQRYWRERLETQLPDAAARDAAFDEIRAEAEGAEVEIEGGGTIASRSRGREFYRVPLRFDSDVARFEKPTGVTVTLRLEGGDLVADEPGKPRMHFTRVAGS